MNAAVIVAAGRGTRMGMACNKVLCPLCGEPVIVHTVRAFARTGLFDGGIVVVAGEPEVEEMRAMLLARGAAAHVVPGGEDRQQSVITAFRHVIPARIGLPFTTGRGRLSRAM